jgi:xanthine dehydrogenase small subunit
MPPPSSAADARTLSFVLDGQIVRIVDPPATMTVLQYLREVAGRCGTKEGCAEGDCGACTVVLGELAQGGDHIDYQAINSCIRFLPTIDGRELVTVESLRDPEAGSAADPHPVQQAMVECHASQCGFCTPGFVMSLFALYQTATAADRSTVIDTIAGNLCRCTGYRPIVEAGQRMFGHAPPARWHRDDAQSGERRARLAGLARGGSSAAALKTTQFHAPRSVGELAATLENHPQSLLLAGGTDVGLWVTKQLRDLPPIIYLGEVAELARIRHGADSLWIGAAVTLTRAWPALLAAYPQLAEQARRFASPPIRNSATLCGNLANGSPIGDSLPALLALDALLELRRGEHTRVLPLAEFYLDYQRKALASGEFIVGVEVPLQHAGQLIASYKIAKRHDQDISAVCATFRVELRDGRVAAVRLAYGGMAATAKRAAAAEAALLGAPWGATAIDAAIVALARDFTPMSDMRASSAYRLRVAGNLLLRFFRHSQGESVTLPVAPVN